MNHEDQVKCLKAVASDIRLKVVKDLSLGDKSAGALSEVAPEQTQSAFSQHLKVLREAGIVKTERKGTQILYSLNGQSDFVEVVEQIVEKA